MTLRLDGRKDADRRAALERDERDEWPVDDADLAARTAFVPSTWGEYRKRTTIYATRMTQPFEVETLEGLHTGKAGDWLAVGIAGEMYPIDAAVFADSYEEADRAQ